MKRTLVLRQKPEGRNGIGRSNDLGQYPRPTEERIFEWEIQRCIQDFQDGV